MHAQLSGHASVRHLPRKAGRLIVDIILVLVFFFPFFWMLSSSLKTLGETMQFPPSLFPAVPQWHNYLDAMKSGPFGTYLLNSHIVTGTVLIWQTIKVIPAADALSQ